MAVVVTCKEEPIALDMDSSGETLLVSNTETPGTDCQVPNRFLPLSVGETQLKASTTVSGTPLIEHDLRDFRGESSSYLFNENLNQIDDTDTMDFGYKTNSIKRWEAVLHIMIQGKLSDLEKEEDLREYPPHLYADEGDSGTVSELDSISISDEDSVEEATRDLGPNFKQLAAICKPPHTQNDAQT